MKRLSTILTALALAATAALAQQIAPPLIPNSPIQITTVSTITGNESTPAVSRSGHIFITTADGELVVLNPDKSEATRVTVASGVNILASPVLNSAGDRVYVAANNRRIAAYAVTTTSTSASLFLLWTSDIESSIVGNELRTTPALSGDEATLYVATGKDLAVEDSASGKLHALATATGYDRTGWEGGIYAGCYALSHLGPSPVILSDGKIVVASGDSFGKILAFNPDGSSAWSSPGSQGLFEGSPAVGTGNRIFFANWDAAGVNNRTSYMRCYDGSNGQPLWAVPLQTYTATDATFDNYSKAGVVISSFGEVFVADRRDNVYGFSQDGLNSQNQIGYKWKFSIADWNSAVNWDTAVPCQTPLVDAGGNVIVSTHDGWFISIKPDGTRRWSSAVQIPSGGQNKGTGSPVMTAKGEVLIFRENGKLFSFQNEHGPDAGIWPGFQRGPTHSGNIGDNAIDRGNLSYTVNSYPGSSYYFWNPSIGGTELVQNYSVVQAATDWGHVGGFETANSYGSTIAAEWFGGSPVQMFGPNGSEVTRMNAYGDAVGRSGVGSYSSTPLAMLWEASYAQYGYGSSLALRPNWQSSEASALNRAKWVAGRGKNPGGVTRAALWPYGQSAMKDLETLKGGLETYWSEGVGVSDLTDIAGNSVYGSGSLIRPFRFRYVPTTRETVLGSDVLPEPDWVALGYTVYPTNGQFGSQYAVTLTPNGSIGGNWQAYTTDSTLTPYLHRPATTTAASYRVYPEWTFSASPYPRTYRPRQLLGLNARGQALLKADVYDPTAEMQYLGQGYVLHTPSRTGYQDITSLVSNNGGTIYGLTDDGKIFGWRYSSGYIPTGFVAVP